MKVAIDGAAFENPHQRGVQRYFREVIDRFPADVQAVLLLADAPRAALPARGERVNVLPAPLHILPRKWRRSLNGPLSRTSRARSERSADVFHSSYFTLPTTDIATVLTVHDMAVERFVEFFGTKWAAREIERKRVAIRSADVLIAVSRATARELEAFYPDVAGRIVVVHHGADHIPEAPADSTDLTGKQFVLVIGDRGGYKNFRRVLEALAEPAWPAGVALKVVGSAPLSNELMLAERMSRASGRGGVEFLGHVDDAELSRLYRTASVTIIPSLVEGFGFPVIEAQRAGCPVACSDIEVFREIAPDSAAFFDPCQSRSLAEAVARAVGPAESRRLREAGLNNARSFTWARCVEQTLAAYARAIEFHGLRLRDRRSPA